MTITTFVTLSLAVPAAGEQRMQLIDGIEHIASVAGPETLRRNGSCIAFRLRKGDRAPYDIARDRPYERSELISRRKIPFGVPVTVEFWRYIVPGAPPSVATIVGQFHGSSQPGNLPAPPPIAFEIGTRLERLVTRSSAERIRTAVPQRHVRWSGPLVTGRWTKWRIRAVFAPSGGGSLTLWRDGERLLAQSIPLGYNDPVGPYWQFGIYRPSATEKVEVIYAGMRQRIGKELPPTRNLAPSITSCELGAWFNVKSASSKNKKD